MNEETAKIIKEHDLRLSWNQIKYVSTLISEDRVNIGDLEGVKADADLLIYLVDKIKKLQNTRPIIPKGTPDVREIRKAGHKIRVMEKRYFPNPLSYESLQHKKYFKNLPVGCVGMGNQGGQQIIEITTKDGREFRGEANCSIEDSFNRKYGRLLAISRALKGEKL